MPVVRHCRCGYRLVPQVRWTGVTYVVEWIDAVPGSVTAGQATMVCPSCARVLPGQVEALPQEGE